MGFTLKHKDSVQTYGKNLEFNLEAPVKTAKLKP